MQTWFTFAVGQKKVSTMQPSQIILPYLLNEIKFVTILHPLTVNKEP